MQGLVTFNAFAMNIFFISSNYIYLLVYQCEGFLKGKEVEVVYFMIYRFSHLMMFNSFVLSDGRMSIIYPYY